MDRDLIIRARDGDHAAFRDVVEETSGRLLAVARLILRDGTAAEDAIQDAFVKAWRNLPHLQDPDRFDAWIRRIAVRACFDRARTDRRRRIQEVAMPALGPGLADSLGTIAVRDELDRGLRRLTPDQRAVLVVTYYLDLPLADGAQALGIPLGTMKSRLDRARSALRSAIDAEERIATSVQERPA